MKSDERIENPYEPPAPPIETADSQIAADDRWQSPTVSLPAEFWMRVTVATSLLFAFAIPSAGFALPFAFACLMGAVRTGMIYTLCAKVGRVPPPAYRSWASSSVYSLLLGCGTVVALVASCTLAVNVTLPLGDPFAIPGWFGLSAVACLTLFVLIFKASVRAAVEGRPRLQNPNQHE